MAVRPAGRRLSGRVEAVTGEHLPFYLAVATKERVTDLDIFQIPQSTLDLARAEITLNMEHFNDVKSGLVPPHFCWQV